MCLDLDGAMNTIDDASGKALGTLADRPERALETLNHLGDWLMIDQIPTATGVNEDLEAVTNLAIESVVKFVRIPENAEALAHVMDGQYRGDRDADIQADFDGMLAGIAADSMQIRFEIATVGDPAMAEQGEVVLPEGVEAAILQDSGDAPVVLLSDQLGFRDMILVAQEAAIDVLIQQAQAVGFDVADPAVGDSVAHLIRHGDLPDPSATEAADLSAMDRAVISVFYAGEIRDATMV